MADGGEPAPTRPARVLHVVETLDRWSVETWLLRLLAHGRGRGEALDWTFYATLPGPGARDCEAWRLGAGVIHSPAPIGNKLAFARALRGEVARGGYDVLHFHHDLMSGAYLFATTGLRGPTRIVHVHNLDAAVPTPSRLKAALARPLLRQACLALSDRIVANSHHALDAFLAGRRGDPVRHRVHSIAIDPTPFAAASGDRAALRRALGIPASTPILLFAGRLAPEKNPVFAVDVLAALHRRAPDAVAVFAGAGGLEESVRARAAALGVAASVRLLGWRTDVAEVMSACDWFILPHPHHPVEGFGVAVVEAQLAGLRLLLSQGVSDAPILAGAKWRRLSLDDGAEAWAEAAIALLAGDAPSRAEALAALRASPMDLDRALTDLLGLYADARR